MSNYIARPVTSVPDYLVAQVIVPANVTLFAGQVVALDAYPSGASALPGNLFTYAVTAPGIATKRVGIVLGGSGFETLPDGRRPKGQPDYTQYTYGAGDVVTVVVLEKNMRYEISTDVLSDTTNIAVGNYLTISAASGANYKLATAAASTAANTTNIKILATNNFPLGGQFGGNFANTLICVVE